MCNVRNKDGTVDCYFKATAEVTDERDPGVKGKKYEIIDRGPSEDEAKSKVMAAVLKKARVLGRVKVLRVLKEVEDPEALRALGEAIGGLRLGNGGGRGFQHSNVCRKA